jgi:outer membrane protein assembly factor BamB
MFQFDPARTGHTPASGPRTDVTERWRAETEAPVRGGVAVVEGTVYTVGREGVVFAFDAETGEEGWRLETERQAGHSVPAVVDGTVYVGFERIRAMGGGDPPVLVALSAADGAEQWRAELTTSPTRTSPAVVDGTVYITTEKERVYAFDAATGEESWRTNVGGPVYGSPAVYDGSVYVAGGDPAYYPESDNETEKPHFYALDAGSGEEEWKTPIEGTIQPGSPAVDEEMVFFVTNGNGPRAFDRATGEERWHRPKIGFPDASPALTDGTLFVPGSPDGGIVALDVESGDTRWANAVRPSDSQRSEFTAGAPVATDDAVYAGNESGVLYALDADSGDELWRYTETASAGSMRPRPAVSGGRVYVRYPLKFVLALEES